MESLFIGSKYAYVISTNAQISVKFIVSYYY